MVKLARINPSTIVIALPNTGRKEKKPIHAPLLAINRSVLANFSFFT